MKITLARRAYPENTLWGKRTAFARSAVTLPKVNRFGWNREQYEPNAGGWLWQILCAIRLVATYSLRSIRNFVFFCPVNNHDFASFPSEKFYDIWITTSIGKASEAVKTFEADFWKFYHTGSFFRKKRKNCSQNFQVLWLQAVITPQWLQIAGNSLPNVPSTECLVSIFTVRINAKKVFYPKFRQRPMSSTPQCWCGQEKSNIHRFRHLNSRSRDSCLAISCLEISCPSTFQFHVLLSAPPLETMLTLKKVCWTFVLSLFIIIGPKSVNTGQCNRC